MTTTEIKSKTIQVNGVPVTCHSDGSITLIDKRTGKPRRSFGANLNGYRIRKVGEKMVLVHRLIALAFHGKPKDGTDVDHINGNRSDNRPENLRWTNHSQNLRGARRIHGEHKYRGVDTNRGRCRARVLGNHVGSFGTAIEAAERFDDVAFYEHNFPLEGLNFPQRILDKMAEDDTDNGMIDKTPDNTSENIERIQTQIDMIRQESRILSYRIERMMEQRKGLSEEKRKLKEQLETLSV
jgi:hypothetical protein